MRINCGPRGIIMTKSTATVNCTAASINSRSHSLRGRRSDLIFGGGSAALDWVGEEGACVVKRATFDADHLTVKALSTAAFAAQRLVPAFSLQTRVCLGALRIGRFDHI